jgi:hypothetical protein
MESRKFNNVDFNNVSNMCVRCNRRSDRGTTAESRTSASS